MLVPPTRLRDGRREVQRYTLDERIDHVPGVVGVSSGEDFLESDRARCRLAAR
jgi:hypothetical protein